MINGRRRCQERRAKHKDGAEREGAPPSERVEQQATHGGAQCDGQLDDGDL